MRIIYIFRNSSRYNVPYPSRWFNRSYWYNAGNIIGYVLQFLAGVGIGYVVGSVVRGVIRALSML